MNKRGTGRIFCLIGSLLFAARYITAAIFMSSTTAWDATIFEASLEYQRNSLLIFSIFSLIIGIFYIAWAEIKEKNIDRKYT